MQLFRVLPAAYFLFSLVGTGLFLAALVTVMGWPPVRSRGLLLACLGLKVFVAAGYALLGLIHVAELFGVPGRGLVPGELMQVVYLLLAAVGLAGDGLLLAGLISLGGVFHAIRRGHETYAPPYTPSSPQ